MASNYHDTGYKELFSHPEFVQQLIEGFAPTEIAQLMNFKTLTLHSGNYITPLFEEKFEDLVWSVEVEWKGSYQEIYLYLLLEFQSTVDSAMPIRLMHYVACFYDHLLKEKVTTAGKGLPPIFPVVLYNGSRRWSAKQDIYEMVTPEPPEFLRPYQPHLRYYLVDECRFSGAELAVRGTALSGVFEIEQATSRKDLQMAVKRIVTLIEQDPRKERLDKVVTRWLKRHLAHLGAEVNLDNIHSLVESRGMLAENLQHWAEKERSEGMREGMQKGMREGELKAKRDTARNLILRTDMDDQTVAEIAGLSVDVIAQLRVAIKH
jgi:predicted transposase/invertase (TIGR01784 family)